VKPTIPDPMGEAIPSSLEMRRIWYGDGGVDGCGSSVAATTLDASKSGNISGPRVLISAVNSLERVSRVRFSFDNAPRFDGFKLKMSGGMDLEKS
jgi:hypothetical protein